MPIDNVLLILKKGVPKDALELVVRDTGIEPVTPTVSR